MVSVALASPQQDLLVHWQQLIEPVCTVTIIRQRNDIQGFDGTVIILFHSAWLKTALGHDLLQAIFQQPNCLPVILSDVPTAEEGLRYLQLGAKGYANAHLQEQVLLKVIEVVALGQVWINQSLLASLINSLPKSQDVVRDDAGLSKREQSIAACVAQGLNNKSIAAELNITERTVKAHLTAIYKKTGCQDRLKLALWLNSREDEQRKLC